MKRENQKKRNCGAYLSIIIMLSILVFLCFYNKDRTTIYIDDKTIVYKGDISPETQEECEKWIKKSLEIIPQKLAEEYNEKIYVMDNKNFKKEHKNTGNKTDPPAFLGYDEEKPIGIYINADIIFNQDNSMLSIVCHEFGHYFDFVMNTPSESEEWIRITKEEAPKMRRPNPYYDAPVEFYAEAFSWYCISKEFPNTFNQIVDCTQASDYISSVIEEYEQK